MNPFDLRGPEFLLVYAATGSILLFLLYRIRKHIDESTAAGGSSLISSSVGASGTEAPRVPAALRPERLALGPAAAGLDNRLSGTVELVSYLGSSIDVYVRVSSADRVVVNLPNRADGALPNAGDKIDVGWPAAAAVVLAGEDGAANT